VKSGNSFEVSHNRAHGLSAKTSGRPRYGLGKIWVFLAASALVFSWTAVGLSQPAQAGPALTVADINSTLHGLPQAAGSDQLNQAPQQTADDAAVSALSSFAQQMASEPVKAPATADDQASAALQAFAQRLGTEKLASIKDQPKLADADNLLDWLTQPNHGASPAPAAVSPKAAGKKGKHAKPPVEAHFVGDKACLTCHATQTEEFQHTLMGRIGLTQKGKFACENCHGAGSEHVKAGGGRGVGGIISFRPDDTSRTAEENNGICLACHERGDRTMWPGSVHEERGLMCTNCHTIMKSVSRKNQLKTAWEPDTCFQCHKDRRAQMFRSSHMPMREGKIVCSDCHNPHGSLTESLLKKDSINDVCYTCHAEKRGPFLFEHEPVRENCDNCHDPHGSINDYSLKLARPRLCYECHNLMGHATDGLNSIEGGLGQSCQNCHIMIHGSNSPGGSLLGR
jgi:DmsE family decaheme c-type cytochrome